MFEPEKGTCYFSSSLTGATLTFPSKISHSSVLKLKHLIRQEKPKASALITSVLLFSSYFHCTLRLLELLFIVKSCANDRVEHIGTCMCTHPQKVF